MFGGTTKRTFAQWRNRPRLRAGVRVGFFPRERTALKRRRRGCEGGGIIDSLVAYLARTCGWLLVCCRSVFGFFASAALFVVLTVGKFSGAR